jgi:hypothetical protein
MRMSCPPHALAHGCSAGAFAPLPVVRVFIRPAVKLQSWPGQAAVLETKPPVE